MTKPDKILRASDWIVSVSILLIGITHNVVSPIFFPTLGPGAFLFVGTGLAFMFLGIFNFARLKAGKKIVSVMCIICITLTLIYCCIFYRYVNTLKWWIIAVILIALILSVLDIKHLRK